MDINRLLEKLASDVQSGAPTNPEIVKLLLRLVQRPLLAPKIGILHYDEEFLTRFTLLRSILKDKPPYQFIQLLYTCPEFLDQLKETRIYYDADLLSDLDIVRQLARERVPAPTSQYHATRFFRLFGFSRGACDRLRCDPIPPLVYFCRVQDQSHCSFYILRSDNCIDAQRVIALAFRILEIHSLDTLYLGHITAQQTPADLINAFNRDPQSPPNTKRRDAPVNSDLKFIILGDGSQLVVRDHSVADLLVTAGAGQYGYFTMVLEKTLFVVFGPPQCLAPDPRESWLMSKTTALACMSPLINPFINYSVLYSQLPRESRES